MNHDSAVPGKRRPGVANAFQKLLAFDVEPGKTQDFKSAFPIGKNIIYRYAGMTAF